MTSSTGTALVTGASQRLGGAIVRDLAANGWAVVIHANRSLDQAEALAREISLSGGTAAAVAADLSDHDQLADLIENAGEPFGPLSLLVNNASVFEPDEIGTLDPARFDLHFALHVRAPIFLTERFAVQLPDGKPGLVVNLIDQRVWKLTPQFFSYTLSKSALWTATQTMAQALAPRIRVNGIGPGPSFKNERQSDDDFRRQQEAVLMKTGPVPGDFGRTIRYLWDTPSITGQMIALDGGQHLAWETADVIGVGE